MNRLDRRLAILRGKREGAFDRNQYYLERGKRTQVARKARTVLRQGRPLVLVTPRWSRAHRFLDDVACDVSLGQPAIVARTLSLVPLKGLQVPQAWAWLVSAVAEFCDLELQEGPAWQAVSRRGFRHVMAELFRRAESGPRRCLMIHGMEHIHVEALRDLIEVFEAHDKAVKSRRLNLVLAGSVDAPYFEIEGAARLELVDYTEEEAVEVLVEHLGTVERHRLLSAIEVTGGIPAVLDALGELGPDALSQLLAGSDNLWKVLGGVADEVRSAMDSVNSNDRLQERLELLAESGPQPEVDQDLALHRAGLVRGQPTANARLTAVRSPWFVELAQTG